jgi:hypothetical protein
MTHQANVLDVMYCHSTLSTFCHGTEHCRAGSSICSYTATNSAIKTLPVCEHNELVASSLYIHMYSNLIILDPFQCH